MMSESNVSQLSPLAGCMGVDNPEMVNGVRLAEWAFNTHTNIRVDSSDTQAVAKLESAFGIELPMTPNTYHIKSDKRVFWLSPNEWLVIDTSRTTPANASKGALDGQVFDASGHHVAVNDLSSGQTIFCLSGPQARAVIARGCPFDSHPSVFPHGRCAQTHVNEINVLLWSEADAADEAQKYLIVVRRSFADYLWRWFKQVQTHITTPIE